MFIRLWFWSKLSSYGIVAHMDSLRCMLKYSVNIFMTNLIFRYSVISLTSIRWLLYLTQLNLFYECYLWKSSILLQIFHYCSPSNKLTQLATFKWSCQFFMVENYDLQYSKSVSLNLHDIRFFFFFK